MIAYSASQPIISYSLAVNSPQVIWRLFRFSSRATHQRTASRAPSSQGRMTSFYVVGLTSTCTYTTLSSFEMQALLKMMLLPFMVRVGSNLWEKNSLRTT